MSAANFQALCDEFCDSAHTPRQELCADAEGVMVFSSEIGGVAVNVMHTHSSHPDSAFLLIDFGPPPRDREADVLRALLLVNFTMLGEETSSTFSIHPAYGNVTLQANFPFRNRSGADLLRSTRILASMALQWRKTHFIQQPEQVAASRAIAPATMNPGVFA